MKQVEIDLTNGRYNENVNKLKIYREWFSLNESDQRNLNFWCLLKGVGYGIELSNVILEIYRIILSRCWIDYRLRLPQQASRKSFLKCSLSFGHFQKALRNRGNHLLQSFKQWCIFPRQNLRKSESRPKIRSRGSLAEILRNVVLEFRQ